MNNSIVRAVRHAPLAALIALAAACSGDSGPDLTASEVPAGTIFLVESRAAYGYMEALFRGRVVRDARGCLQLESSEPATVVWPFGSRLESRDGELYVRDRTGHVLAKIGAETELGGGYRSELNVHLTRHDRALAATHCPGPYWLASPSDS